MTETIGQQLRQAREAREITLEQVARATHMKPQYLQALESGNFSALPSMAQARGFLRSYADFLGLNAEELISQLREPVTSTAPLLAADGAAAIPAATPAASPFTAKESLPEDIRAIFCDIGQQLARQRELLGLPLEDVARHTRLRTHYLRALEAGDLESLPSPVQGRGMLKNYATFLGMDPEPLLIRFAEGLQAQLALKQAAQPVRREITRPVPQPAARLPSPLRRLLSGELFFGAAVVVFLLGFVLWVGTRILDMRSQTTPAPTVPSIADVLLTTATASPTSTSAPPTIALNPAGLTAAAVTLTPEGANITDEAGSEQSVTPGTPEPTGAESDGTGVQVYLTIRQRAWLRVLVDGKVEFEGRVLPNSAYQFSGSQRVEILTGNAAAIQVFYNQQDLGTMGLYGEVAHQVFALEGIQTPTATVTLTASPAPRQSPTSVLTATHPVSPTPEP